MILVTGGTGTIGRQVVRELAERDVPTRVIVRDPARADSHGGRVEILTGDLDVPWTLEPAFEGATRLFLLSPGPDVPAQDAALVAAAQSAGLAQVVLVSSLGAELGGIAGGRPHLPGEALLKESGLPWTILHPSEFMTNTLWWRQSILSAGVIAVPSGTGRVGFIDPADIASVAVHVLTSAGHDGKTYRLTGPQSLSTAELAAQLGVVLGIAVRHVDLPDVAFRTAMEQAGLPPPLIEMQSEYYAAVREGRAGVVAPDVEELLERAPRNFMDWATLHEPAFRSGQAEEVL